VKRGPKEKLSLQEKHELRRYREAGVSINRLACMWGVSKTTVYQALRELVRQLGPERLPDDKKHLARRHLFTSGKEPDSASQR
jgi:IS30 family transposase